MEGAKLADDVHPARRLDPAVAGPPRALLAGLLAERERWAVGVPVLIGCGIGFYFALTVEPPGWIGPLALVVAGLMAWSGRRWPRLLLPGIGFSLIALGFAVAQLETWQVAAPVLERQIGPVRVEGRIVEIDPLPE